MQSPDPTRPHPTQPKVVWSSPPAPGAPFQGFTPPAGNLAQLFIEIWDLQCYGLNKDLRFALLALARETVGEASQRGGSICDFAAVSWPRWMERLEVSSINTVKTRMTRLVEMRLVEVGECGPRGGTAPRFRLRWANGGADFGTPAPVLQGQMPIRLTPVKLTPVKLTPVKLTPVNLTLLLLIKIIQKVQTIQINQSVHQFLKLMN